MPNFKKPRGGFSAKFCAKSPFKAADAALMQAVGQNEAKTGHMGKLIEAMGKSERSSQMIDNVQKIGAMIAGVPPGALPESGGEAEAITNVIGMFKK
jgi:hypothetical protein